MQGEDTQYEVTVEVCHLLAHSVDVSCCLWPLRLAAELPNCEQVLSISLLKPSLLLCIELSVSLPIMEH